jgi:hypothetical protein
MLMRSLGMQGRMVQRAGANWWLDGSVMALDFLAGRAMMHHENTLILTLLSCSRATSGYAARLADGMLQTFAPDELRITDRGLLVEEARTNYILYSNDVSQWIPNNTSVTLTADATPIESKAAHEVTITGGTNSQSIRPFSGTPPNGAGSYTLTLVVKAGSTDKLGVGLFYKSGVGFGLEVDHDLEILSGPGAVSYTNQARISGLSTTQWTTVRITRHNCPSDGSHIYIYPDYPDSVVGKSVKIFSAQLENGQFPTSYIETTGASATRAADVVQFADLSWLTQGVGTMLVEFEGADVAPAGTWPKLFELLGSTTDDKISMYADSGSLKAAIDQGGVNQTDETLGSWPTNGNAKAVMAWSTDDVAAILAGSSLQTDATSAIPVNIQDMFVGQERTGTTNVTINSYIRSLVYWPTRKSDTDLQGLVA